MLHLYYLTIYLRSLRVVVVWNEWGMNRYAPDKHILLKSQKEVGWWGDKLYIFEFTWTEAFGEEC